MIYNLKWKYLESYTKESESLVDVKFIYLCSTLSSAGLVKSCMNQPGPSGKAKYSWETDSELVPWGKGEKNPK